MQAHRAGSGFEDRQCDGHQSEGLGNAGESTANSVSRTFEDFQKFQEVSSYRIQNTLLDQTRIINQNQKLVIWINRAMHITIKIGKFRFDQ